MPLLASPPETAGLAADMAATWLLGRDLRGFGAGTAGAALGAVAVVLAALPDLAGAKIFGMTRLWLAPALWLLSAEGAAGCGGTAVTVGALAGEAGAGAAGAGVAGTAAAVCGAGATAGAPSSARRSAAAPLPFLADWENQ